MHSDFDDDFFVPNFGIHPWWSHLPRVEGWEAQLRQRLSQHPNAGVGEVGLDKPRVKRGIPFGVQLDVFRTQLGIAIEMNRTCTVHCVQAFGPLLQTLTDAKPGDCAIVMHSFSGSGEFVHQVGRVVKNIFFSVSARSPSEEVLRCIPLDRLLIETDAPDQKAVDEGGGVRSCPAPLDACNDSSQLELVALRVSRAIDRDLDFVKRVTTANAIRAFGVSRDVDG